MSENIINTDENASLLKELAVYADQVLLNTIKDAVNNEFISDKVATLEICEALLLDLVAVTRRMYPEDPRFRHIETRRHRVLYENKQHLKLLQKYRSSYKKQVEKTTMLRGQLQARDKVISALRVHAPESLNPTPPIVVLCGSTRFLNLYDQTSLRFTLEGWIVLSVGSHKYSDKELNDGTHVVIPKNGEIDRAKPALDELHKRKIDLADLVYIINKDKYIGSSTASEIYYAQEQGKTIEYLEPTDIYHVELEAKPLRAFKATGRTAHYHDPTKDFVGDCAACIELESKENSAARDGQKYPDLPNHSHSNPKSAFKDCPACLKQGFGVTNYKPQQPFEAEPKMKAACIGCGTPVSPISLNYPKCALCTAGG